MKLSPHHIIIKHCPGTSNPKGDFVSRYPVPTSTSDSPELNFMEYTINIWEGTNILDDIRSQQLHDSRLSRTIDIVQKQPSLPFGDTHAPYILSNNLLYKVRYFNSYNDQRILHNKYLLVIPQSMQRQLLLWAHHHPTVGHAGRLKTLFRLSSRVYWPSMRKDAFKHVKSCSSCQQFKYINYPTPSPMQLHTITTPWYTIGIDIMEPYPPTPRHKRFLLVILDYFTRWIEIFPLRRTTPNDIIYLLIDEVFCRYGIPTCILSDNGPQFIAQLFAEICRSLGIGRKLTANYHSQTNMTERVNLNLKAIIALYTQNHPGLCDKEIQKLAFAIRTSVNETAGDTPASLTFGRDPQTSLDLILAPPTPGPPPITLEHQYIRTYRADLIHNLRVTYHLAREKSEIKKIHQKFHYDKHTSNRKFVLGDLLWVALPTPTIDNTTITSKLCPKYQGTCRLVERLSPSTFLVTRITDNVNLVSTNIDRMKLYYEPQNKVSSTLSPSPRSSSSDNRRYPVRTRSHSLRY